MGVELPVLTVSEYDDPEGLASLNCPQCGEPDGLHIDDVILGTADGGTVQIRLAGEDQSAHATIHTSVRSDATPEQLRAHTEAGRNHRRHFVKLIASCEHCGPGTFGIMLKQHKGATMYGLVSGLD